VFKLPREGRYWLLAVVVLFAAGWIKGINLILLLAHLMLSLLALNWLLAFRQLHRLSARRHAPAMPMAGETIQWEVVVANARTRSPQGVLVVDEGADHREQWFLSSIPGATESRLIAQAIFPRRGLYRLEPLRAECLHPFGLVGRARIIGPADEWIILPKMGRLNGARFRRWLSMATRGDGRVHRLARPSMVRQDDLHGLRPFRPGDSPRWIHWRTSARRNQKMVREFEEAAGQNLIIVFDPSCLKHGPAGLDDDLEEAISLTAAICNEWCSQRQDQIVLAIAGQPVQLVSGYTCRATLVQLLRALAMMEGQNAAPAASIAAKISARLSADAAVLVVGAQKPVRLASTLEAQWRRIVVSLDPSSARDFYDETRAKSAKPAARPVMQAVGG